MTRACLIVSPYFPPSTLAGVHRARHLAKHLPAAGWTPIVVCVDEAFHEERLDPGLAALVPPSVEVVKVPALPAGLCRPFGLGEISLRAWRPLRRAVMGLMEARKIDAVLITGSPFYPMLLGPEIKRRFGVPVVLDFQDPWVSHWGGTQSKLSKSGLSHRLSVALEPRAVRAADYITSVSDTQNAELAARYPWLDAVRTAAIPIGGDPEDFEALRRQAGSKAGTDATAGNIVISYVGTFMPRTGPLIEVLLNALAKARQDCPVAMSPVRLQFVGTSNQPNDTSTYRVRQIAEAAGVGDIVHEIPQRVPFLEALGILARSQGLLLVGSDEPHYTASKIYPGMMAHRPFISLFHKDSSSHAILSRAGGGLSYSFSTPVELAGLVSELARAFLRLATRPEMLGQIDPAAYAPYEAKAIAAQYAQIFDRLVAVSPKAAQ